MLSHDSSPGQFDDRVVLVVGASRGIGAAVSFAFAERGAAVVLASRDRRASDGAVRRIRQAGGEASAVTVDVRVEASVEAAIDFAVHTYGSVDIAFNNAGAQGPAAPIHEQTTETWVSVLETNLTGLFYCLKYELARMVIQGSGAIVNTASVGGVVAAPGIGPYCASKHGVIGLTRSVALDYAASGIRVNAVAPGAIDTDIFNNWMSGPGARQAMAELHPLKRIGHVDELNGAVLWLASEAASYVTGSVVTVDGGYTIR